MKVSPKEWFLNRTLDDKKRAEDVFPGWFMVLCYLVLVVGLAVAYVSIAELVDGETTGADAYRKAIGVGAGIVALATYWVLEAFKRATLERIVLRGRTNRLENCLSAVLEDDPELMAKIMKDEVR